MGMLLHRKHPVVSIGRQAALFVVLITTQTLCSALPTAPALPHPAAGGTEALLPFANIKNVLEKLLPKSPDDRKLPQSAQSQKHSSDGGAQGEKCLCRIHLRLVVRPPVLESQVSWEFRALKRQRGSKNPYTS